jgi:hypothetical protein
MRLSKKLCEISFLLLLGVGLKITLSSYSTPNSSNSLSIDSSSGWQTVTKDLGYNTLSTNTNGKVSIVFVHTGWALCCAGGTEQTCTPTNCSGGIE